MRDEERYIKKAHYEESNAVQALANQAPRKKEPDVPKKATGRKYHKLPIAAADHAASFHTVSPPAPPFSYTILTRNEEKSSNAPVTAISSAGLLRSNYVKVNNPTAECVFNGVPGSRDPRWPDPFTLIKTSVVSIPTTNTVAAEGGASTYAFGTAFVIRGDGVNTYKICPISAQVPNWAGGSWGSCGINNAGMYSRPLGVSLEIRPIGNGVDHPYIFHAFSLAPTSTTLTTTGWPTNITSGPTSA